MSQFSNSGVGITASIRLDRGSLTSDIAAARAEFSSAFTGIAAPLSTAIVDSIRVAAPQIRSIIAQAVGVGVSQGAAAGGGSLGGYSSPLNFLGGAGAAYGPMTQSRTYLDWQLANGTNQYGGVGTQPYGPSEQPAPFSLPLMPGGGGLSRDLSFSMSPRALLGGFVGIQAFRAVTEFARDYTEHEYDAFQAENMPGNTPSQQIRRAQKEVEAYRAEENDLSGVVGGARSPKARPSRPVASSFWRISRNPRRWLKTPLPLRRCLGRSGKARRLR
jgi:hypothetical protein